MRRGSVARGLRCLGFALALMAASIGVLHPVAMASSLLLAGPDVASQLPNLLPMKLAQGSSAAGTSSTVAPATRLPPTRAERVALFNRLPDAEAMALIVPDKSRFVEAMFELREMVASPRPFHRQQLDRLEADFALRDAAIILREARGQRGALDAPAQLASCPPAECLHLAHAGVLAPAPATLRLGATAIVLLVAVLGGARVTPWLVGILGLGAAVVTAVLVLRHCVRLQESLQVSCMGGGDGLGQPRAGGRPDIGGQANPGFPMPDPDDDPDFRNPNTRRHIFGEPRHNLDQMVRHYGSERDTFAAVRTAVHQALRNGRIQPQGDGVFFRSPLRVGRFDIRVSGRVIDNEVRISDFWIP